MHKLYINNAAMQHIRSKARGLMDDRTCRKVSGFTQGIGWEIQVDDEVYNELRRRADASGLSISDTILASSQQ